MGTSDRFARSLGALAWLLAAPVLAMAASTLNFPRLGFDADRYTGIAIANPTAQEAVVTLTAYGSAGERLAASGFRNPVAVTIAPRQQLARLTAELFGTGVPADTVAWIQATSAVDGLTGFFLVLDGAVTFMDGADLPPAAQRLLFPNIRIDGGFTTELDLVNPADRTANVQLQLRAAGGAPVTRFFALPAHGVKRIDAAGYFEISGAAPGAYVSVQSDVEIAGIELVKDPGGDWLALNARRAAERFNRLVFPQLAVLGGYTTELGIVNLGAAPVVLTITAFKPSGAVYDAADLASNPVTRTLAGEASLREDLTALFGFRGARTLDGWVEVRSTVQAINGYLAYGVPATGAAAAVTSTTQARTRNLFSHIATSGYFTGVAVLNPGTLAANVRVVALRPTGEILGSYDTALEPGQRIARLLGTRELIPEAAAQNGGLVWIRSDIPVYALSIFGSDTVLVNIPAQEAPEDYAPDTGLPAVKVRPPLAIVPPSQTQQFRVEGTGDRIEWQVDGTAGGAAVVGTVTPAGVFTAPRSIPPRQVVTVSAATSQRSSAATVDVLDKNAAGSGLRVVRSVAFLASSARIYAAEFAAVSALATPGDPGAVENGTSQLVEIGINGARSTVATFGGENIARILPMRAANGRDYLLLAGALRGRIIRLDPATRQFQDVVTGLVEPSALVFDPLTGDLLVAERDQITTVTRSTLEAGLTGAPVARPDREGPGGGRHGLPAIAFGGASGLATDRCTGNLYFTVPAQGLLVERNGATGRFRTVLDGLRTPTSLLGVFRKGISCPNGLHLMLYERDLDRTRLVIPADGSVSDWISASGVDDIAFLPAGNPFTALEGILLGENRAGSGTVSVIGMTNLYGTNPFNPPEVAAVEAQADLAVTGSGAPDPVAIGATLTYTLTVANRGPAAATAATLSNRLPPETTFVSATSTSGSCTHRQGTVDCALGSVSSSGRVVVTLRARVDSRPASGTITSLASAGAAEIDPDVANNSASVRTAVSTSRAALLEVTGLTDPATAGVASPVTLTARDAGGAVATDYLGTVRFTSTDAGATLPADYTFTAADRGTRAFSAAVILRAGGTQDVIVTDTAAPALTGRQTVQVNATAGSGSLQLALAATTWTAGVAGTVTVTARAASGAVAAGYRGTVTLTSSDGNSILPSSYTFTAADAGVHTFAGIELRTAGTQCLTATDGASPPLQSSRTVTVRPGPVSVYRLSDPPASLAAGTPADLVVTAVDVWNNVAVDYLGTVRFTSTDPLAVLPAAYAFTPQDGGVRTFRSGVTLRTPGSQSVTAIDSVTPFVAGAVRVVVTAAPSAPTAAQPRAPMAASSRHDPPRERIP